MYLPQSRRQKKANLTLYKVIFASFPPTKPFRMQLAEAQKIVDDWINTVGIRYYNELTNTAILMEETGEVARLMARLYGEQSFKNPADADTAQEQLADEFADVLFVLICLANQTGVDLTEALRKNLDKKTKRDSKRHRDNPKLN